MLQLTITNANTLKKIIWKENLNKTEYAQPSDNQEIYPLIAWEKIENNPIPTIITKNGNGNIYITSAPNILLNGNKFEGTTELKNQDGIQYYDKYGVLYSFRILIEEFPKYEVKPSEWKNYNHITSVRTGCERLIPRRIVNESCQYGSKRQIDFTKRMVIEKTCITLPKGQNCELQTFENEPYFNLNQFAKYCYNEAKKSGFHKEESSKKKLKISNYLMNLHGEISELWEAYRKGNLNNPCDKAEKMKENDIEVLTCMEEELADIIIRAGDTAAAFGIDLERAVLNKIKFNRTREYRNGNKIC